MLDINLFRESPDLIKKSQKKRGEDQEIVDAILRLDAEWRELLQENEKLKHERNRVSLKISDMKKANKSADKEIKAMQNAVNKIAQNEIKVKYLETQHDGLRMNVPNILHESVPAGKSEADNKEIRSWGKIPKFSFTPKSHVEIGTALDLIDTERAAKVAGARFYYLKGDLVKLNYALLKFAIDFLSSRGFVPIQPPYMLNRASIEGAVPLAAFEEMIYKIQDEDLYLIGTAEHAIAEYYKDEVLEAKKLPLKFVGVSPCFRKEAGAHGKDTKGIFRTHQFEKVEQFIFCKPEDSWDEFELLMKNTEELFKQLEIPFRTVVLCSKETGMVAAKTYDLEGWFPAQNAYRELGSCSNALDYQAIRSNIRYRDGKENKFPHMLNNTAIATERAMAAIIENHQQKDGTIKIPKALVPYMGFGEIRKR